MPTWSCKVLTKSLFEGEIVPKIPPVLSKAPEQGSGLGTICDVIGSFSGGPRRMCCNRSVVISWPSRDAVGIFWKPTFYPNHRARNPIPVTGWTPFLGHGFFRALRLGPFEGFPASM